MNSRDDLRLLHPCPPKVGEPTPLTVDWARSGIALSEPKFVGVDMVAKRG